MNKEKIIKFLKLVKYSFVSLIMVCKLTPIEIYDIFEEEKYDNRPKTEEEEKMDEIRKQLAKRAKPLLDRMLKADSNKRDSSQRRLRKLDFDEFVVFIKNLKANYKI